MNKKKKLAPNKAEGLIPDLRFPEFENDGEWKIEPLGKLSDEIVEKTKGRKYKLMSITSGIGLVSQIEKFGREIAGDSYRNYYVIHKSDFAYNKSSTKLYGEGEIAMYEDNEIGAVPNSIFTCFRFHQDKIYPLFAKYPFVNNLHGNWLKKFIAVGARANGALQVNVKDLFSLPFPYPILPEQQKIAACLSFLDEVIAAHSQKLGLLKDHKKGLMQNLFPQEGEKVPKKRFKQFKGEWLEKKLGEIANFVNEKTPLENLSVKTYISTENLLPDYAGVISASKLPTSGNFTKYKKGDVLISNIRPYLKKVWFSDKEGACSNDVFVVRAKKEVSDIFLSFLLKNDDFINYVMISAKGVKMPRGDKDLISKYPISFPKGESGKEEQQKIASCLSTLDELMKAQAEKIEQLKLHKKGLMQGLFPK